MELGTGRRNNYLEDYYLKGKGRNDSKNLQEILYICVSMKEILIMYERQKNTKQVFEQKSSRFLVQMVVWILKVHGQCIHSSRRGEKGSEQGYRKEY